MGVGSRVRLACGLLKLWSTVVKELDMKMLKKAKGQYNTKLLLYNHLNSSERIWFRFLEGS